MEFVAVGPRTGMCAVAAELFERLHDAHEEDVEADCERFSVCTFCKTSRYVKWPQRELGFLR